MPPGGQKGTVEVTCGLPALGRGLQATASPQGWYCVKIGGPTPRGPDQGCSFTHFPLRGTVVPIKCFWAQGKQIGAPHSLKWWEDLPVQVFSLTIHLPRCHLY